MSSHVYEGEGQKPVYCQTHLGLYQQQSMEILMLVILFLLPNWNQYIQRKLVATKEKSRTWDFNVMKGRLSVSVLVSGMVRWIEVIRNDLTNRITKLIKLTLGIEY